MILNVGFSIIWNVVIQMITNAGITWLRMSQLYNYECRSYMITNAAGMITNVADMITNVADMITNIADMIITSQLHDYDCRSCDGECAAEMFECPAFSG